MTSDIHNFLVDLKTYVRHCGNFNITHKTNDGCGPRLHVKLHSEPGPGRYSYELAIIAIKETWICMIDLRGNVLDRILNLAEPGVEDWKKEVLEYLETYREIRILERDGSWNQTK